MLRHFEFEKTSINGLIRITPFLSEDSRGGFLKDYSLEVMAQNNITHELKEVFYTKSHKGVIRAIHFQRVKQQSKLVRCVHGSIFDVVVDLRPDSPTFKQWQGFDMNDQNDTTLYIPGGCGHGYLVLEPSIVSYKCNEKFYGEYDDGIMWNDPDIGIDWPLNRVDNEIILSEKDETLQSFQDLIKNYGGLR